MRYLQHITITTGDVRKSPRSGVSSSTIAAVQAWIDGGLRGETVAMTGFGAVLTLHPQGQCLVAEVADEGTREPLVRIGVGAQLECGAALWRDLHGEAGESAVTEADTPPAEAWVAGVLLPGLLMRPDATDWLGDFERCLAWAWLERGRAS